MIPSLNGRIIDDILARDIAENLESAMEQFRGIYEDLEEK